MRKVAILGITAASKWFSLKFNDFRWGMRSNESNKSSSAWVSIQQFDKFMQLRWLLASFHSWLNDAWLRLLLLREIISRAENVLRMLTTDKKLSEVIWVLSRNNLFRVLFVCLLHKCQSSFMPLDFRAFELRLRI